MDMNSVAFHSSTDSDVAERMKFESFKLGDANSSNNASINHHHARSRSRNLSVSSISSVFTSTNSVQPMTDMSPVSPTFPYSAPPSTPPATKRGSHHRRRSSVSTRHESADMMGVAVADLPLSLSDDNINLGDKDSVRRRALWALEGKSDNNDSFKVEIPDISTPEINKKFDLPSKASFPPSIVGSGYSSGLNNVAGKRDSFGKHLASSASAKELLHTLVEEDEEEEDREDEHDYSVVASSPIEMSPAESTVRAVVVTASTPTPPSRPRPASLNLRPLSLNKENIIGLGSLPTPSTPTPRGGLRSLTLASSPSPSFSTNQNMNNTFTSTDMKNNRRQSLILSSPTPAIAPAIAPPTRRPSLNLDLEDSLGSPASVSSCDSVKRRASISYRCSTDVAYGQFALPTPELTPTAERHRSPSPANLASTAERPLSETEQHFLYQAHATFVQRISDLERALAVSRSRPVSCASDASSVSLAPSSMQPEEPSDEMLQLIADLKAERDELIKDIEGWRVRVSDLDKQVGILARRIELERREAWVARERSGLLEIEKRGLEKAFQTKSVEVREALDYCKVARAECDEVKQECEKLREELQRKQEIDDDRERLKYALAEERKKRGELEATVLSAKSMPAIVADDPPAYSRGKRIPGFLSIDSEATDVESIEEFQISLKSVEEEHEFSDEEMNVLTGYENEEDGDVTFQSHQGSSVGSFEEVSSPIALRTGVPTAPPMFTVDTIPTRAVEATGHARRGSLVEAWTFATGALVSPREAEVDKFFGCLEDVDDSDSLEDAARVDIHGDNGRSLFSQSLLEDDDDDYPPFLLPKHIGFEIPEERLALEPVLEEDEDEELDADDDTLEDDFVGEVVEGGIVFKFTPPDDSDLSSEVQTPSPSSIKQNPCIFGAFEEDEDEGIVPFKFPQMTAPSTPPSKPPVVDQSTVAQVDDNSAAVHTPIRQSISTTPSSIPRSVSLRTYTPTKYKPERCVITRNSPSAFVTPPTKRGGTIPTFIPQPRARDVMPVTPPSAKSVAPTFVRQPQHGSTVPVPMKHATQTSPLSSMPQTKFRAMNIMIAARQ